MTPLGPLDKACSSGWLSANNKHSTRLEVVFSYNIRFGLLGRIMHTLIMRRKIETSLPDTLKAVKDRVENNTLERQPVNQVVVN